MFAMMAPHAEEACQEEISRIFSQAGVSFEIAGLKEHAAYALFSKLILEAAESIKNCANKYTTDLLLLQSRRHLACMLFSFKDFSYPIPDIDVLTYITTAIAYFAAPGNTLLPDKEGQYQINATARHIIDMHILFRLCMIYRYLIIERKRLVHKGVIEFLGPFPKVRLPCDIEKCISIHTQRTEHVNTGGIRVFSRMGMFVKDVTKQDLTRENIWFNFIVGVIRRLDELKSKKWRFPSEVRPFGFTVINAKSILEELQLFRQDIQHKWGMTPLEIVAPILTICHLVRIRLVKPKMKMQYEYTAETRSIFSFEQSFIEDCLIRELPFIFEQFGEHINSIQVKEVIAKFFDKFLSQPGRYCFSSPKIFSSGPESHQKTLLLNRREIPFLFQAGNKILLDLFSVPLAFSSILNRLDITNIDSKQKGKRFEKDVREFLVSRDSDVHSVPQMERTFFENERPVGEADVVVRVDDTAFLLECKSRRVRNIDDCFSYGEAVRRLRPIREWTKQVRHIAEYLATHPIGKNYEVPSYIKWIVPIICSTYVELTDIADVSIYLVKDEIPITMTPREVLEFIQARLWKRNRVRVTQYKVIH